MEQTRTSNVRVCFQQPDGLYPINGHLFDEKQLMKLISLGGEWICVRWIDPYLGMDKHDHKLCEAVQKYLNCDNCEDPVTGAWILNNRRKVEMIFGTPNAIQVEALLDRTLEKMVSGGVLNEADKQDIINATIQ